MLVELAEPLGKQSNNVAEYSGLIAGLRAVVDLDPSADVVARMDSKLVVEQMSGRWKIKHEDMRRLALEAGTLRRIGDAGGSSRSSGSRARRTRPPTPWQRGDGRQVHPPGAPRRAGRGEEGTRPLPCRGFEPHWSRRTSAAGAATRPLGSCSCRRPSSTLPSPGPRRPCRAWSEPARWSRVKETLAVEVARTVAADLDAEPSHRRYRPAGHAVRSRPDGALDTSLFVRLGGTSSS